MIFNEQLEVHVPFGTSMYGKMVRFDYIITPYAPNVWDIYLHLPYI